MLIGIAGKAGAGKDTAAEWFMHNTDKQYREIRSLAKPIKEMLNAFYGSDAEDWKDREWKEAINPHYGFSPRQAAQRLGTEWRDLMDPTGLLWCKFCESAAMDGIIIPDIRFPHEQDWVHSHGGIVICIHRNELPEVAAHSSENSLDPAKVDVNIMNTSTIEDLHLELSRMWEYINRIDQQKDRA